jgi:hypothetical protein
MRPFFAHAVIQLIEGLNEMSAWAENSPSWIEHPLNDGDRANARKYLSNIQNLCDDLGFKSLRLQVDRDLALVKAKCCTYRAAGAIADSLRQRIQDEFESVRLLWVEDDELFQKDDLFGEQVGERFKGASFDIKEAGTCFALRRYTACVYHLMRVAEAGLRAIGKRVGYQNERPMWEPVLKYIDAELRRNYDEMSVLFKGDVEFLSGISSQMHALNLACRRRVAHIERTYTLEESKRIYEATRGLMQHIATKLSEVEEEQ